MDSNTKTNQTKRNDFDQKVFINSEEFIYEMQSECQKRAQQNEIIYHYTSLDILKSILEEKTLHLTSLKKTNDLQELFDCKEKNKNNLYIISFTINNKESIALWHIYSKAFERGVRVGFSIDQINGMITLAKNGVIKCFAVENGKETRALKINSIKLLNVRYTDVRLKQKNPSYLRRRVLSLNTKELKDWERFIIPGYFKDYGWSYEKECRILIEIAQEENYLLPDTISIKCPTLFSSFSIQCSPCLEKDEVSSVIHELPSDIIDSIHYEVLPSSYQWKVLFADKCKSCKKRNNKSCKLIYYRKR